MAGFAILLSAGAAEAGVTYVDQQRSVEASFNNEILEGTKQGNRGPASLKRATGYGPFDGEAEYEFEYASENAGPIYDIRARATQVSTLDGDGVRASGDVSAESRANVSRFRSRLFVTFEVPEPTRYTLDASLALPTATGALDPHPTGDLFTVSLFAGGLSGRPAPRAEAEVDVTVDEFLAGAERPELSAAGTLQPGSYRLLLEVAAEADPVRDPATGQFVPAEATGSYTLDLRFGDGTGPAPQPGPGPGPGQAIPLPPAGWAGLVTLAGMAAARYRAGQHRRS